MIRILIFIIFLFFPLICFATPKALEGFEFQSTSNLNVDATITTGTFRTGAAALRVNPIGASTGYYTLWIPAADGSIADNLLNTNDAYVSFYFRIETAPSTTSEIIYEADDTGALQKGVVRLTRDRTLAFYNAANTLINTGSTILSLSTWYLIEVRTGTGASANYEIKINGVSEISGTTNQGTDPHGTIHFGKVNDSNSETIDVLYDDIVLNDSHYTGFHNVRLKVPVSDSTPQGWNQGTGVSDYQEIDEIPTDEEITYIQNKSADSSMFNLTSNASAGITDTIIAVKNWCRASVTEGAGDTNFIVRLTSNVTNFDTAGISLAEAYTDYASVTDVDPDTSVTWGLSGLDAATLGVYESFGVACNATTCGMEVAQEEDAPTPTPTPTVTPTATATRTPTPTPTVTPTSIPSTRRLKQRVGRVYTSLNMDKFG